MNQAIRDSCKKPEEAEKGCVKIRPSIPFVSDASYSDLDKDKSKFIEVTCRYMPENADSKKNNYQAHVKTFDHGTVILTTYIRHVVNTITYKCVYNQQSSLELFPPECQ